MSYANVDLEYLVNLYNGYSAIAERVDTARLKRLHISTKLDDKIRQWINLGQDIVLTGSPGDGKTHLIDVLEYDLRDASTHFVKDASQMSAEQVLDSWRDAKEQGHPFVLAINHAPLRRLAEQAGTDQRFRYLSEMVVPSESRNSEIDNFVMYSEEQEGNYGNGRSRLMIVDLGQRELLSREIISQLLNKLCELGSSASCKHILPEGCDRCPIKSNVAALTNPRIRDNVSDALSLVGRRGYHATMRDLIGFLAYMITGGVTCEYLWQHDEPGDYYEYYNLMYDPTARGSLFDALRRTFDPGTSSDVKTDLRLWMHEIQEGWIEGKAHQPTDIEALRTLKRRYFFEHSEPISKKLKRMLSEIDQEFDDLVTGKLGEHENVEKIVEMINLLYAPLSTGGAQSQGYRYRLRLWNMHRYSIGPAAGYAAMRSISSEKLAIYHPKLNPKYEDALEIRQDHILLAVKSWVPGDPALRVDWEMYKALAAAKQGTPIDVQPYHILRRLDLFLRDLGSEVGPAYSVETVEWSSPRQRTVIATRVDRKGRKYESL